MFKGHTYEQALQRTPLMQLKVRRQHVDMLSDMKIITETLHIPDITLFQHPSITRFRAQPCAVAKPRFTNRFDDRLAPMWNRRPVDIVTATFVATFKRKFDDQPPPQQREWEATRAGDRGLFKNISYHFNRSCGCLILLKSTTFTMREMFQIWGIANKECHIQHVYVRKYV